jgi:hypothetical protein
MPAQYDRRTFMTYFASIGLGSTLLPGVLWAKVADGADITLATIAAAEDVAGLKFDDAERTQMLDGLKQQEQRIEALHKIPLANSVSPALVFNPVPPGKKIPNGPKRAMIRSRARVSSDYGAVGADSPAANNSIAAYRPLHRATEALRSGSSLCHYAHGRPCARSGKEGRC